MGKWWSSTRELWRLCDLPVLIHLATTPQECQQCLGSLSKSWLVRVLLGPCIGWSSWSVSFLESDPSLIPFSGQGCKKMTLLTSELTIISFYLSNQELLTTSAMLSWRFEFPTLQIPTSSGVVLLCSFWCHLISDWASKDSPNFTYTLHEHFCDPGCS